MAQASFAFITRLVDAHSRTVAATSSFQNAIASRHLQGGSKLRHGLGSNVDLLGLSADFSCWNDRQSIPLQVNALQWRASEDGSKVGKLGSSELPTLQSGAWLSNKSSNKVDESDLLLAQIGAGLQITYEAGKDLEILVIGGGGREHAICYGLQKSPTCSTVFCAPGNPGIAAAGDATCMPDLDIGTSSSVISFCQEYNVGLVVVGPEAPLVAGLVDDLQAAGIAAFGPSAKAAALEGSKDFMKRLCTKYNIPTAKYKSFFEAEAAKNYVREVGTPIVIKADGLAAGKGVIIATTLQEAFDAVDSMLVDKAFGAAGGLVVVEEFLDGEEVSFFALVDGEHAVPMASAQDHKRVGDGDRGPNTGGMGAYSPAPALTPELQALVMDTIIHPTVKGMEKEGCKFVGVLYAGLIIDKQSGMPKLLEYNVRFGDPECQVLIPRLQSDLASTLLAACKGELEGVSLSWSDEAALVVVLASEGYPGKYRKGTSIKNLEKVEIAAPGVKIFHAGTALDPNGNFVAAAGRVLGVTALGKDILQAQERAYHAVDQVDWPDGFYRRDIGWRAVAHLQECNTGKV